MDGWINVLRLIFLEVVSLGSRMKINLILYSLGPFSTEGKYIKVKVFKSSLSHTILILIGLNDQGYDVIHHEEQNAIDISENKNP